MDLPPSVDGNVLAAINEIAATLATGAALDDLLRLIVARVCDLLGVDRATVYLRESPTSKVFRGRVGWADGQPIDGRIKRLLAGMEADGVTSEILLTKRPVLIRDANTDPRMIRATQRAWRVRAVLGVPLIEDGEVTGILYLDDDDLTHTFTDADEKTAVAFASFAAIAIKQGRLTGALQTTVQAVERQNKLLRKRAELDEKLTEMAFARAGSAQLTRAVAELTGKPCVLFDGAFHRIAEAPEGAGRSAIALDDSHRDLAPVRTVLDDLRQPRIVPALNWAGLPHRSLVAPILDGSQIAAYLVLVESGSRISPLDGLALTRTAAALRLELAAEHQGEQESDEARESLLGDLLREGTENPALARRAARLGIALEPTRILCLLRMWDGQPPPSAPELATALATTGQPLVAKMSGDLVAAIEISGDPDQALARATGSAKEAFAGICGTRTFVAGLSLAQNADDLPRALRAANDVVRCLQMLGSPERSMVAGTGELGVGRFVLSNSGRAEADRFVADTLGPLLAPEKRWAVLLGTLSCFVRNHGSVRETAEQLEVHENTVRYRITSIESTTGLSLAAFSDDFAAVRLATLVLELEGRLTPEGAS